METNQPDTGEGRGDGSNVATTTKERAADVASDAGGAVTDMAHEAADEARTVAQTATSEASDVVDEVRRVVHDEADKQTRTVSHSLRRLAVDLQAMAEGSSDETMAADYVSRMGRSLSSVADRLDDGGVDGALDDLRQMARGHPGAFLGGAAMSGFTMARMLRHANAPARSSDGEGGAPHQVDLRDPIEERAGRAPALPNDVQEWARP
ncbi:MAG: hypothetical protein JJE52_18695 [Acidimicrobiia bacterium]|nr:hypothetical protein [Acidimicrobiia bacterium]